MMGLILLYKSKTGVEEIVYLFNYLYFMGLRKGEKGKFGIGNVSIEFPLIMGEYEMYEIKKFIFISLKRKGEIVNEVRELWYLGRVDEIKEYVRTTEEYFSGDYKEFYHLDCFKNLVFYL